MDQPKVDFPQISVWHVYSPELSLVLRCCTCHGIWMWQNREQHESKKNAPEYMRFSCERWYVHWTFFLLLFFNIYIYMYIYMGVCVSDLIQSKHFSKLIMCLYCIGFNSQVYWIHKYTELKFCPIVLISWK